MTSKKAQIPRNSSPHTLTNFEIEEYYENESRFLLVFILEIIYLKQ